MTIKGIARSCLGDVFDSHEELDKLTESYHKCWLEMEVTGTFKLLFIPYGQKYWWELNLAVEPKIAIVRIFGRFKFGGLVRDRHMYIRPVCE